MIPVPNTLTEGTGCHRLFMALRSGAPKSHHELYASLQCIVHSRASDLRLKHNCLIDTWQEGRTTWYQLRAVREGEDAPAVSASPLGPPKGGPSTTVVEISPDLFSQIGVTSEAGPGSSPLKGEDPGQGQPLKQLEIWEAAA